MASVGRCRSSSTVHPVSTAPIYFGNDFNCNDSLLKGTGKTTTIVECILQIYTHMKDSKILVAAQSNSSVTLLTKLLIKQGNLSPEDIIRISSQVSIDQQKVPADLLKYSTVIQSEYYHKDIENITDNGVTYDRTLDHIRSTRLIVGTCVALGILNRKEIHSYFTHVFIDEAGQCEEPEALIPLTYAGKQSAQVILAGDPKQMPPIVLCKWAKQYGLERSMLERYLNIYSNFNVNNSSVRAFRKSRSELRSIILCSIYHFRPATITFMIPALSSNYCTTIDRYRAFWISSINNSTTSNSSRPFQRKTARN